METGKRTYVIILAVLFALFLCFPMFYDALDNSEKAEVSESENRNLAAKPFLDITYLDVFPKQYTAYYNDHFPFRQEIMRFFGRNILWGLFGKSPVPDKVTIGKDGWLFQAENRLLYSGQLDFTPEEVETIYQKLHERAQFLSDKGIGFYLIIAPMKCEVYPEKLPRFFHRTSGKTRTKKLIERIEGDSLIHFIDIQNAMTKTSDTLKLYPKTDHHWSTAGGFVVYKEIMRHLKESYPGIVTLHDSDIFPIIDSSWCGGLANMIQLCSELREIRYHYTRKHPRGSISPEKKYEPPYWFAYKDEYEIRTLVADTTLPSIVVIRDSFFGSLLPFFSDSFQKSLYIFDAWMYGTNFDIISKENPDIVLLEVYEPLLDHLLVAN